MVLFHTNRFFFSFSPLSPWKCVIFHRLELTHSMIHDWIIFCFNPIPTWVHCVTMVISGRMPVTNHTKTSFYVEYISLMLQFNVMCAQCVRSSYSLAQMHTLAITKKNYNFRLAEEEKTSSNAFRLHCLHSQEASKLLISSLTNKTQHI